MNVYWQRVLISASVFGILAISWDLLVSCGMVSLGQALFFGVGAYFSGYLNHTFGWSPFITVPLAAILGGAFCTIILIPVLRLRGIYFSMVTLMLPLMLERIIEATRILGGTEGISGLTPFPIHWIELLRSSGGGLAGSVRLPAADGHRLRPGAKGINDNDRSVISAGINIYMFKAQALSSGRHGRFCRGLHDPGLHVRGHAGVRPGLFDAAHRRGGGGRHRTMAGAMLGALSWCPCPKFSAGWAACASSFMHFPGRVHRGPAGGDLPLLAAKVQPVRTLGEGGIMSRKRPMLGLRTHQALWRRHRRGLG